VSGRFRGKQTFRSLNFENTPPNGWYALDSKAAGRPGVYLAAGTDPLRTVEALITYFIERLLLRPIAAGRRFSGNTQPPSFESDVYAI
jgi:hypothetical protein